MRQSSVPGRVAAVLAVTLALAASAGCMSVGDDERAEPAPSGSPDRRDTDADPDGGYERPGGGRHAGGGGRHADSGKPGGGGRKAGRPELSPSPGASAAPEEDRPGPGAERPQPPQPGAPKPPAPRPTPSAEEPAPPVDPPVEEPVDPPVSEPPQPTDPPSASSAPEVHAGAMRLVEADGRGMRGRPTASPQPGPA
ncbi:hypothetical protein ACIQ9E_22995 [Streptomyces sp. NPDC094448]|uniref:hypothetical protein n=1 Tax=Streptomyces sp. NPDC094448 TaxID=3366063 RepID=UPI00382A113C